MARLQAADIDWDRDLSYARGAFERLAGIDVYYDFTWADHFHDRRVQFNNGLHLANFVKKRCPDGLTPSLLLIDRDDRQQGPLRTDQHFVWVVNLPRYRKSRPDAALSYIATLIGPDIARFTELHVLASELRVLADAHPEEFRAFLSSWAMGKAEHLKHLREIANIPDDQTDTASLSEVIAGLRALDDFDAGAVRALASLDRESRIWLLRLLSDDIWANKETLELFLDEHRETLAAIIRADVRAPDIVALARRRAVLAEFGQLLTDADQFAFARKVRGTGNEGTWQKFIEEYPWLIGSSVAPQFLHSWSRERLEQTVRGYSLAGPGKRADAVLRTAGAVSALVLVEIKHHQTPLLSKDAYRPGVWRVSGDVAGGVAQCQTTADETVNEFGKTLDEKDRAGFTVGTTFVCRPRTILVVGSLAEFVDDAGHIHHAKFESFERFRRGLRDPEIVTFDELFERARFVLDLASEDEVPPTTQGDRAPP
jgi:hypothetical protein